MNRAVKSRSICSRSRVRGPPPLGMPTFSRKAYSEIMSETPFPWDRLPAETPKSHAAFLAYIALGARRSVREAARQAHQGSIKTVSSSTIVSRWLGWSAKHKSGLAGRTHGISGSLSHGHRGARALAIAAAYCTVATASRGRRISYSQPVSENSLKKPALLRRQPGRSRAVRRRRVGRSTLL